MDNSDQNSVVQQKPSLLKKIAWGSLVVGAGVAIAAVVGFIFFPVATKNIIDAAASLFGDSGKAVVDSVLGNFDVSAANQAATAVSAASDRAIDASKNLAVAQIEGHAGFFSWLSSFVENNVYSHASNAASSLADAEKLLDTATKVAVEKSGGLIHFITHHKIIAGAAAALGTYGLVDYASASKNQLPQPNPEVMEAFAMKEDMRKAQNLMVLRAAYAGNPEAQAMLAQQQPARG